MMDFYEIASYVGTGLRLISLGGATIISGLVLGGIIAGKRDRTIESPEELTALIEIESQRLGISEVRIEGVFNTPSCAGGVEEPEPHYWKLHPGIPPTLNTVCHELLHIKRHEAGLTKARKEEPQVRYFFKEECRAMIYGAFRIEI